MKLYYSTGACSASCHIAFEESGLAYTPVEVSWDRNENVAELEALNPLGTAPVLVLDDGKVLTQNAAILEYIADKAPKSNLLPAAGTYERAKVISWLSFVAADFHKSFAPLFYAEVLTKSKEAQDEIRTATKASVTEYLKYIDTNLKGKQFIAGDHFTVADPYLFVVTGWCKWMEIDTKPYTNLTSYMKRVFDRPAVQKALTAEGLVADFL